MGALGIGSIPSRWCSARSSTCRRTPDRDVRLAGAQLDRDLAQGAAASRAALVQGGEGAASGASPAGRGRRGTASGAGARDEPAPTRSPPAPRCSGSPPLGTDARPRPALLDECRRQSIDQAGAERRSVRIQRIARIASVAWIGQTDDIDRLLPEAARDGERADGRVRPAVDSASACRRRPSSDRAAFQRSTPGRACARGQVRGLAAVDRREQREDAGKLQIGLVVVHSRPLMGSQSSAAVGWHRSLWARGPSDSSMWKSRP